MKTSMERRINILCKIFKIIALFTYTLFARLYMKVRILFACGIYTHCRFIYVRREVWAHTISLAPPFFTVVIVPSQQCERPCKSLLRVSIFPLSTIFLLDFGTSVVFFFFNLFKHSYSEKTAGIC